MTRVLIVEDNVELRDMLREYLAGHDYEVRVASDGQEALQDARHQPPDLILLDLMMPRLSGLDFLRQYRREARTPVIVLTARDTEQETVTALELGADDYVTKPCSLAELLARVRALLRRSAEPDPEGVLRHGDFELDPRSRRFRLGGEPLALTPSEFELMRLFLANPGRVFSRLDLLERVQEDLSGSERTIDVHIRNLRAKVEARPSQPRWLETVYGVGYRLRES